ncbi:MAG: transposase, partial [Flavobacteriales bacterium]
MSTYLKVYYHVVFSTKGRKRSIPKKNKDRIHRYINGIIKKFGQDLIIANCMPDHIHLLISFHNDMKHS